MNLARDSDGVCALRAYQLPAIYNFESTQLFPMAGTDYYDLDAILAEEELIPCVTQEEFSYLSHLDPDASAAETKRKHFLKKHTKLKLPVWAVESWAILGYCRCTLPRAYNSKSREQYLLSNANDAQLMALPRPDYFRTGKRIADMMQQTYLKQRSSPVSSPQMVQYRGNILAASRHLQHTLHVVCFGNCSVVSRGKIPSHFQILFNLLLDG